MLSLPVSLCFLLFFSSFCFVSPHNYVSSPSRATGASLKFPCIKKIGTDPHVQVIPNQLFQMEWSMGHGNNCALGWGCVNTNFVVITHADDFATYFQDDRKLKSAMIDYMRLAPASAYLNGSIWKRNLLRELADDSSYRIYFNGPVRNSSEGPFITRDPIMLTKGKWFTVSTIDKSIQMAYKDAYIANDKRIEYFNPKYPWIEAVHSMDITVQQIAYAYRFDTANFRVPARKGPGNYIAWYYWNGYYDCVDISVLPGPKPVALPYGNVTKPQGTGVYTRVDHCEFVRNFGALTPCRIINKATMNIRQCQQECDYHHSTNWDGCNTIQVMRASDLPISIPRKWPHFPTAQYTTSDPRCNYPTVEERLAAGCPLKDPNCDWAALNPKPDDYICYGTKDYRDDTFQATEPYMIASEPEDPRFFSSCFFQSVDGGFIPTNITSDIPLPWKAGDMCVDCQFNKQLNKLPYTVAPNWELGLLPNGPCQDCSSLP